MQIYIPDHNTLSMPREVLVLSITKNVNEIRELCKTARYDIWDVVIQVRDSPDRNYYLGKGKMESLNNYIRDCKLDDKLERIVVNGSIRPLQHFRIEQLLGVTVVDRLGLILEIFNDRAKEQTAKLQVDLARLQYETPFIREWIHNARHGEHPGFLSGGEYEIDNYYEFCRKRIKKIRLQLEKIKKDRFENHRNRVRRGFFSVCFVGYTNTGKTSLFNALTGESLFVDSMVFSTLSTTIRHMERTKSPILLVDTIGFISDLPPWVIESFAPTLQEIELADLLIFVIDISESQDKIFRKFQSCQKYLFTNQKNVDKKIIFALNKIDLLAERQLAENMEYVRHLLAGTKPNPSIVYSSTRLNGGVEMLKEKIQTCYKNHMRTKHENVHSTFHWK